jgi:3-hydroxyacyl-CoA dehydrogenase
LRYLFHAERRAARTPDDARPWPIRHVGVVGGGTMGAAIALSVAEAGLPVRVVELSESAAGAARERVAALINRQQVSGRLSLERGAERLRRITIESDLAALRDADLVIEAVFEDLPTKASVFRSLSHIVRRDTVLASNTSYLDIDLLADVVDAPERTLGLHFFSPAHVMRLLEIVRPKRALPEVVATALAFAKRLRKLPVIAGVAEGFIGNRLLSRWRLACDYALEEGAMPAEIDAALEAYGFAMGPYAVADLAGLDIGWAVRKHRALAPGQGEHQVPVADWLCEMGRFGQKSGRGWYDYRNGKGEIDPEVEEMVRRASDLRGLARRPVPADAIVERVNAAIANEAAKILAEGIAARASDIDLVLVNGYGYPAWRGGPLHQADIAGLATVLDCVKRMQLAWGPAWAPAALIEEMAQSGQGFAERD